jgi:hypothetical protein
MSKVIVMPNVKNMVRNDQIAIGLAVIGIIISIIAVSLAFQNNISTINSLQGQVTSLQNDETSMQNQIASLQNTVNTLNEAIDQQTDQVNRLRIPLVIKQEIGSPSGLISYFLTTYTDELKANVSSVFYPAIDSARDFISGLIGTKFNFMNIDYINATRISGSIYNATVKLTLPIRLGEIPGLSVITSILGDITLYPKVYMTTIIDVANETISNVTYVSANKSQGAGSMSYDSYSITSNTQIVVYLRNWGSTVYTISDAFVDGLAVNLAPDNEVLGFMMVKSFTLTGVGTNWANGASHQVRIVASDGTALQISVVKT